MSRLLEQGRGKRVEGGAVVDEEPAYISVPAVPGVQRPRATRLRSGGVQRGSMVGYQDVTSLINNYILKSINRL